MKTPNQRNAGITLLEVMIVLVIIAVLLAMLLPALSKAQVRSARISCINKLKQVGLSFRQWAIDHEDKNPMSLPMAKGGTMDHPRFAEPWVHFAVLSNELNTPKILICPEDPNRSEAYTFATNLSNQYVSYFVGLEADELQPGLILSGDRNLTTNGVALGPGLYSLHTNDVLAWTKAMHQRCGNLGFSDGSVHQYSAAGLQQYLRDNPQTNRLAIP